MGVEPQHPKAFAVPEPCDPDRGDVRTAVAADREHRPFRSLQGEELDGWLEKAAGCEASVVKKFAASLKKDLAAVKAGLTQEWSTGPVEGFITKLKLLKREG